MLISKNKIMEKLAEQKGNDLAMCEFPISNNDKILIYRAYDTFYFSTLKKITRGEKKGEFKGDFKSKGSKDVEKIFIALEIMFGIEFK